MQAGNLATDWFHRSVAAAAGTLAGERSVALITAHEDVSEALINWCARGFLPRLPIGILRVSCAATPPCLGWGYSKSWDILQSSVSAGTSCILMVAYFCHGLYFIRAKDGAVALSQREQSVRHPIAFHDAAQPLRSVSLEECKNNLGVSGKPLSELLLPLGAPCKTQEALYFKARGYSCFWRIFIIVPVH